MKVELLDIWKTTVIPKRTISNFRASTFEDRRILGSPICVKFGRLPCSACLVPARQFVVLSQVHDATGAAAAATTTTAVLSLSPSNWLCNEGEEGENERKVFGKQKEGVRFLAKWLSLAAALFFG